MKVAYIMSRFPHLPETFILREMVELERLGLRISLYPLILQNQVVLHQEAREWLPRAHAFPYLSPKILVENTRVLLRQPARYLALWKQILVETARDPNFFTRSVALLPKAAAMAQAMQEEGIQHIHAHYATHPALVAWIIHRLTGIRYSVTVHAHDIFMRKTMLATKLREAAFIIAISEFNRDYLAKHLGGWVFDKTEVIHCGIEPKNYLPRSQHAHPESQRPFEILNIGSLQPYKGQSYLIEACAMLRDRGIPFRCRIIGGGEREPLQGLIDAKKLNGNACAVELLGPKTQEEVAQTLPQVDCYAQPSIIAVSGQMEGIPVALMEALACEIPCVATNISGIPELVRPGETGDLVPPADTSALADALEWVYRNPEEAARKAAAGRALVNRSFNIHSSAEQIAALFRKMAG